MCVITGREMELLQEPWKEQIKNASCCWKLWTQLCSKLNRFLPGLLGKNLGHFPTLYSIFLLLPKQRFLKNKHTHRLKKKKLFIKSSASNQTHQSLVQKAHVSCEWGVSDWTPHRSHTACYSTYELVSTYKVWPPGPAPQVLTEAEMSSIYSATLTD